MKFSFSDPGVGATRVSFVPGKVGSCADGMLRVAADDLSKMTKRKLIPLIRKAVRVAREHEVTEITFEEPDLALVKGVKDEELGRTFAENILMANYEFTAYKTKKQNEYNGLATCVIHDASPAFREGVRKGALVGEAINACRELSNIPGKDMTPTVLANSAKKTAEGTEISVTVLEKKDVEKLGMGLILGVDQASAEALKFIVMEYWGASKKEKPIVLIGKGITFDTGGINLKPGEGMLGMNQDMSGGAAVMAAVHIAAKLKLKKNVVVLVPAVENAISGSGIRPGDILRSMNGKTVEVLNTDAEGRLILADALTYAEVYEPRLVIDVATLTGASIVAVGKRASVVMTKNQELEDTLRKLGELSGEYVWPLPLWEEYQGDLKSNVADVANVNGTGPSAKSGAGCIQGGTFLSWFTEKLPLWAHIDMASRMESIPDDNLAPGAAGAPVRLLVRILESS